jgi:ornithine decarboxylase
LINGRLKEIERLAERRGTPLLVLDRGVIGERVGDLQEAVGGARVCYALKTNPHWRIVDLVRDLGAGFEISSEEELRLLLRRGVSPHGIIASNPVKTEACVRLANEAGVQLYAIDSYAEVEKLSRLAPRSRVFVRLTVSNEGSQWPLTRKFGVEVEEAVDLLEEAERKGLEPYGLTFHVGSQNTDPDSWARAIEKSKVAWDLARDRGIELRMLNVGGGFPIHYTDNSFSMKEIGGRIRDSVDRLFPNDVDLVVEPGRILVGEAGTLVSTVIGKAVRNGERWLYLDVGVFNGLMESVGGIEYPLATSRNGSLRQWSLAGPSCDSMDIVQSGVPLPEMEVGDKVFILSAGAYTTAYASRFDGVNIPRVAFL